MCFQSINLYDIHGQALCLCKFRVIFLNGKSKGRLYIKETDLYNKYIHESDVRGVLLSKYNYPV